MSLLQRKRKPKDTKSKKGNKSNSTKIKNIFNVEAKNIEMNDFFETNKLFDLIEPIETKEKNNPEIMNEPYFKRIKEIDNKSMTELKELLNQKNFESFLDKNEQEIYTFVLVKYLSKILSDFQMFKEDYTTYIYNDARTLLNSKELDEALKVVAYNKDNEFLFKEFLKVSNYRWEKFIEHAKKYKISLLNKYLDLINPELKNNKKEKVMNQINNNKNEEDKFEIKKAIEVFQNFPEDNQLELFIMGIVFSSMKKREQEEERDRIRKNQLFKEKLEIQNFNCGEAVMISVLEGIKFNKNIVEINLSGNNLSPKSLFCLGSCCKILPNLSHLDISKCYIDNDKLYLFIEGTKFSDENLNKRQFNLEKLNLKDNPDIVDNNIKNSEFENPIALILEKFKLKNLNLTNTKLGGGGVMKIFNKMTELLSKNKLYLETLNLICNNIKNEECLKKIGDFLLIDKCPLEKLILSKNLISTYPESMSNPNINYFDYLMKCLGTSNLKELYLINCDIGINGDDINILYEMLKNNKSLVSIRLFGNKINDMKSFSKIIGIFSDYKKQLENDTLKCLDLSKNQCNLKIDDEFMKLIENLKLEYLDINQNNMISEEKEIFRKRTNELSNIRIIY